MALLFPALCLLAVHDDPRRQPVFVDRGAARISSKGRSLRKFDSTESRRFRVREAPAPIAKVDADFLGAF